MTAWRSWLVVIGLVLAAACYYLPWYTHATAGFTTNAFDLAEWTSLHPAVRSSSPPLWTSFLLRFPQLMIVAALALIANRFAETRARWIWRGIALLLALRFFPPSDFFLNATGDPNYRQMMLLTVLGVGSVVAALALARIPAPWQDALLIITLGCSVLAGWVGLARTATLLDNFEISVSTGPGIIGLTLTATAIVLIVLWPYRVQVLRARSLAPENKKGG